MSILESISLGETLFLNSILTNTETLYGLKKNNTEELEKVDKMLIRNILSTGIGTPIPMLYLELGCIRIQTIIKCRRINFLHYLISSHNEKTLHKFFMTQWNYPNKGDWTHDVKKDLMDFDIEVDLDFIRKISKNAFKNIVKLKAKNMKLLIF